MSHDGAHDLPARDPAEEALVAGLRVREPGAVAEFLERTHRPVYAMTGRLTTDPELRHDWCLDVLLKVLDEVATGRFVYRRPGCFWSWFRTRAYYLLINLYGRHKRQSRRWTAGETGEFLLARLPLADGADPLRLLEAVEARSALETCLEKLPSDDQRRALTFLLLDELSYEEVAEAMDAPLNTVRSWIRRARIAVRRCVAAAFGLALEES